MSAPQVPARPDTQGMNRLRAMSVNAEWERRQAVRLLRGGLSKEAIAVALSLSLRTVDRRLESAGLRLSAKRKKGHGISNAKLYAHLRSMPKSKTAELSLVRKAASEKGKKMQRNKKRRELLEGDQ